MKNLYPELIKAGGLKNALNNAFAEINSTLRVTEDGKENSLPIAFSSIERENKFSQIYIAAKEKLYLPDFWKDGVCLAQGKTDNILLLVKAVDTWLTKEITTEELAIAFNFITLNQIAKAFDIGNETEYTWNQLLNSSAIPELKEFIEVAIKDDVLKLLFPFTSLYTLCFSRCTGYPYNTKDLPNVTPKIDQIGMDNMIYVVTKNKREYLGEGTAIEALKIVKSNLPKNIKPAEKGTADEY